MGVLLDVPMAELLVAISLAGRVLEIASGRVLSRSGLDGIKSSQ